MSTTLAPTPGLPSDEARRRLEQHGPNEIRREEGEPWWKLLLAQFQGPLTVMLLGATALSAALSEVADAVAIAAILVINGFVGFFQEYRAARALAALRDMTAPRARVLRDGRAVVVPAADVVPGDVLMLEAGDVVAADGRLLEANALATNEGPLTGESVPVDKSTTPAPADAPLAERHDQVFLGTAIARGTGLAEVLKTGMETELGRIATLIGAAEQEDTPLQQRLAKVAKVLLWLCLAVVGVVAVLGLAHGEPWIEVLLTAVSLAVAAVPEGLPAVVTIALAVGVQRMAARHVLVRKLPAVETLGCATVIATDKTGTLTTGSMIVRDLWGPDEQALLYAAAACSDAELADGDDGGTGDPTELAILAEARRRGIHRVDIERRNPRTKTIPFDGDRKRMAVARADGRIYVKGALETVLPLCRPGTPGASEVTSGMARRGLRVLAVASGAGDEEDRLELLGVIGLADPPRPEAIEAIAAARRAGIRTVMITGDHPVTAEAIAREMALVPDGADVALHVHARVTAEEKLRIVRAEKARGEIVAMTGDGVNDAPAIREAHIGIAMGKGGTEVTREAADMVLTDDDFASIVAAIREGRAIYENIRKTLVYLLTGNLAELAVMLFASIAGFAPPLLPLQLLWINLVTDGLPALALVIDPPAPDVLDRPPRRPDEPMLGRPEWVRIVVFGLVEAGVVTGAYAWAIAHGRPVEGRTLAFSVLVWSELLRAFGARSTDRVQFEVGFLTNVRLVAVVAISCVVQLGLLYHPATRSLFSLEALPWQEDVVAFGLGLVPVSVLEISKLVRRLT